MSAIDFSIVKKHPLATVGVVAATFVIVYLAANSGGGSQVMVAGPSDQAVQAGMDANNLTASMVNAANDRNFQLSFLQQQQAGDYAIKQLEGGISTVQQTNAITGQLSLAQIGANVQLAGITSQENIGTLTLNIQKSIIDSNNLTQLYMANTQAKTSVDLATIATNGAIRMNEINTDAFIQANTITAATQLGLAGYQTQVALGQIDAMKYIATTNAKSSKTNALLGLAGSILGAIF